MADKTGNTKDIAPGGKPEAISNDYVHVAAKVFDNTYSTTENCGPYPRNFAGSDEPPPSQEDDLFSIFADMPNSIDTEFIPLPSTVSLPAHQAPKKDTGDADLRWLSEQGVKFALPKGRTKGKFDAGWQNTPYTAEQAIKHAKAGGNVGILTGKHSGNIIAIDRDVNFPQTCEMLGQFARTAKIVRDNAPDRGKFLYRIAGDIPPTISWKSDPADKHPACEFLGDNGQRHALCSTSTFEDGRYILLDKENGIQELTPVELDYIWRMITGGSIYKEVRDNEEEEARKHANNEYSKSVFDYWTTPKIFKHFGKANNGTKKDGKETRILGNGGLLIAANNEQWSIPGEKVGGGPLQAWTYCKSGKVEKPTGKDFWTVVNDMADAAGIEKPKAYVNGASKKTDRQEITTGAAKAHADTCPYDVQRGCIGIWKTIKNSETGEEEEQFSELCNFNAWIVADVGADDGEEISRKIAIAGTLDNGTPLPEIEIDADDFEAMKWPVARWGARVSIVPWVKNVSAVLRHAIQRLSADKMIDRRTLTHTGWADVNGKRVFLHAGGAVGADDVSVSLPANLKNYSFPNDGAVNPVEAMRESIKLLDVAPARVSAPMWAAMYLAPLSEILLPVFTVAIEGGSGSLKSSYSAVMLNHFGAKFTEYAMPADWLATANSLEKLCFHAKDIPLIIDDFRPSTNPAESRALQDAVSRITRAAGNRQGRSRLDANSEFKRTYAPRGVVAMTAERKALGKSVNSRILTIDVEPGDIDSIKLAKTQQQRHVYAYAMRGFIESVAKDYDQLSAELPAQVAETRAANSDNGHHKRLPNATAILHTAFCCAMSYAVEIGAISETEADRRTTECYLALQSIEEIQNEATEAEDPALKYISILATLIAQNKAYLSAKEITLKSIGDDKTEKLGWHDGENIFLLPGAFNTVCKYASNEGWTFPSDEATLRKELERNGWIGKSDTNRLTTKQRIPGSGGERAHVIAILHEKFTKVLAGMGLTL